MKIEVSFGPLEGLTGDKLRRKLRKIYMRPTAGAIAYAVEKGDYSRLPEFIKVEDLYKVAREYDSLDDPSIVRKTGGALEFVKDFIKDEEMHPYTVNFTDSVAASKYAGLSTGKILLRGEDRELYILVKSAYKIMSLYSGGAEKALFNAINSIADDEAKEAGWNDKIIFTFYFERFEGVVDTVDYLEELIDSYNIYIEDVEHAREEFFIPSVKLVGTMKEIYDFLENELDLDGDYIKDTLEDDAILAT